MNIHAYEDDQKNSLICQLMGDVPNNTDEYNYLKIETTKDLPKNQKTSVEVNSLLSCNSESLVEWNLQKIEQSPQSYEQEIRICNYLFELGIEPKTDPTNKEQKYFSGIRKRISKQNKNQHINEGENGLLLRNNQIMSRRRKVK